MTSKRIIKNRKRTSRRVSTKTSRKVNRRKRSSKMSVWKLVNQFPFIKNQEEEVMDNKKAMSAMEKIDLKAFSALKNIEEEYKEVYKFVVQEYAKKRMIANTLKNKLKNNLRNQEDVENTVWEEFKVADDMAKEAYEIVLHISKMMKIVNNMNKMLKY